jgi:heme-degrading monooxygenase HmoA
MPGTSATLASASTRRPRGIAAPGCFDRTEFLTLSLWDSVDAIRAFAGDDIEAAVLYPEDARYLIDEPTVTHYQVLDQVKDPSGPGEEP